MPSRNRAHARTSLLRLSHNPQLLFNAPAPTPLAPAKDLHSTGHLHL